MLLLLQGAYLLSRNKNVLLSSLVITELYVFLTLFSNTTLYTKVSKFLSNYVAAFYPIYMAGRHASDFLPHFTAICIYVCEWQTKIYLSIRGQIVIELSQVEVRRSRRCVRDDGLPWVGTLVRLRSHFKSTISGVFFGTTRIVIYS